MGPPLATIRHCLKSLGTPAVGLSRQPNLPGCLLADGPHLRPWPAGAAWLLALLLGLAVPAVAPAQSQKSTEQQLRKARGELQQIARERLHMLVPDAIGRPQTARPAPAPRAREAGR